MDKIQPKALLFDMGGVVLGVDFKRVFKFWESFSALDTAQMHARFTMDEAYEQHEKGQLDGLDYFAHLRAILQLDGSDSEMVAGWNAIFGSEISETLDAISIVRSKVPAYGFTNTNKIHQEYWEKNFPRVRSSFEQLFVSSEIGLRKPDAEAFEYVLDTISVKPGELLFFDDSQENIEGANKLGIQTVLVTNPASVKTALNALS